MEFLSRLDRRWIFLMMLLAVAVPLLSGVTFPEEPSPMVIDVFHAIDDLPDGSNVVMAMDYDPAGQGELQPMAAAFIRHCAEKEHKLFFLTLWPQGTPLLLSNIELLKREYPAYEYGVDYVNLGYQPGYEVPIKLMASDLYKQAPIDARGNQLSGQPIARGVNNLQQMDLIVSVSAGWPGAKEWVQYAASPYKIKAISGTTGVQTPMLYPYIPNQLIGVLGGIKAAAEYEQTLIEGYPDLAENDGAKEALRRMGPQLVAHMLIVALIVLGNVIFIVEKKKGRRR